MATLWTMAVCALVGGSIGYAISQLVHLRPARANARRQMAIQRTLHDARRTSLPHDNAGPSRQSKIRPQRRES